MNRRNFLSLAALAIAGKAAERVFPFRVYSIPKEIVIADTRYLGIDWGFEAGYENIATVTLIRNQYSVAKRMMLERVFFERNALEHGDRFGVAL